MKNIIEQYREMSGSARDAIKTLRSNIQFASIDKPIKTILITSVVPHDGKSTTALFLGISMAEEGKKTLIVETDYRRPMVARKLGKHAPKGILSLLSGDATIDQAVEPAGMDHLYYLDAEALVVNPVELINSQKFAELVKQLREKFDTVIFDSPPLGLFIDAALVSAQVDGTVMIFTPGRSDYRKAQQVMDQLEKANARVLGAVLVGVERQDSGNYYYYYYQDGKRKKRRKHHKKH
ncbi:MAG: CpsD/CapB family tyrosine-protein kinase [Clostridiales bacterium]|nr:CpsD/CapB family tyrosine-protein kinase [Clostridiales bacterium]